VMLSLIQQQRGRVVDAPGDNVLAEFGSVVDAVRCAVETQKELKNRNAQLPENRRMEFRIGVNLGDVVEDGEQILGDGVNIAARLESLSEAGGICISGTAYDQVENKLGLGYQFLGEQIVKNIAKPVRVYKVLMEPGAAGKVIGKKKPRQQQRATIGVAAVLIVAVAAIVIWKLYAPPVPQPEITSKEKITVPQPEKPSATVPIPPGPSAEPAPKEKVTPSPEKATKPTPPPAPKIEVASKEKMAFLLPDKPSIAVLPFANLGEDPKLEYLGDGLSDDITTALCKVGNLFVISRESSFSYKGKRVKVRQVAEELGVRYVLEGSVRKVGDKVRITAQLIDAVKGHHLWAERFDRELRDIFAVQDKIIKEIITALQVQLTEGEEAHIHSKGTEKLEAFLRLSEARAYLSQNTKESNVKARELIEHALALDPNYGAAYFALSWSTCLDVWLGASKSPKESLMKAMELARKAIELDNTLASAQGFIGFIFTMMREQEKGVVEAQKAVDLDPGSAYARFCLGFSLNFAGRPEEGQPHLEKAVRLNPFGSANFYHHLGVSYRETGQYDKAIAVYKRALQIAPNDVFAYLGLASSNMYAGREDEARAAAAEVLRIDPNFSLERFSVANPMKDPAKKERWISSLRKAGLK
jgi:adenylate cyclase